MVGKGHLGVCVVVGLAVCDTINPCSREELHAPCRSTDPGTF